MALRRMLPSLTSLEDATVAAHNCLYNNFTSPKPPELPPFDYEPKPYRGPVADEIIAKRTKYLGSSLIPYYEKPINIVEEKMQYLFDESGKRYLDAYSVSCGHCHPEILDAITEQRKLLQNAKPIHLHHAIADFAEGLASKMPGNLKVAYFVNSGDEARELSMMMAQLYSGNLRMIALRNAYRGINIVEEKMQYLFDESGKRYLDAYSVSCGHCHPEILDAITEQRKLLQNAKPIHLHHAIADFAEGLASKMPGNLKVAYFVNSGDEARELSMMMARLYSGNLRMIALRNAYRGGSVIRIGQNAVKTGLIAPNTWNYATPQGEIHHVSNPDPYRGIFGSDSSHYAKDVQDHIDHGASGKVAGFIAETIQGVLGAVELAPGYLKLVYDIVRKAGGVCIAEEFQTGFGRVGSHYWSFEMQGVIPDIVTMGHGLPLGAVVTTPEIANVMARKIQLNTFGGNPVSSAGALAFLRVLDKEKRQKHCADVGSHLIERLRDLQQRHDIIGDVRGRGLIVGIEFVTEKKEKTPAKAETAVLLEKLRDLGVLVIKGGLHRNVFVIRPPMCFTKEDADFLVDALDYSISNL